jgi:hypothetical protein
MYQIELTQEELDSLGVVANWYESAEILLDNLTHVTGSFYGLQEHIAWEYQDAIPSDWSYPNRDDCPCVIPPCIGGELAKKLETFYLEIV